MKMQVFIDLFFQKIKKLREKIKNPVFSEPGILDLGQTMPR